jgi:Zn-dependent protease with chaperone function
MHIRGIPQDFATRYEWLRTGLTRQPLGTFVALIASWTGLIVAFWFAFLGMFLGALVGAGLLAINPLTRSLFHAGAGEATGFIGLLVGAVGGAGGAFVAAYSRLLFGSPIQVLVGIASGIAIAIAIVVVISHFEGEILRLRGYRRLSRDEVKIVATALQRVGPAMGLTDYPRFAMSDSMLPNAWTHMQYIVLTKSLLHTLEPNELAAVLAHELHHWRSGDAVGARFVWACCWPIAALYNIGVRLTGVTPKKPGSENQPNLGTPSTLVKIITWFALWPVWLILRIIIAPAVAARSRAQEYEADAAAKAIGYGPSMMSALIKMSAFEGGRTGFEDAIAADHPPTELRLEALQELQPGDEDYEEGQLGIVAPRAVGLRQLAIGFIAVLLIGGGFVNVARSGVKLAVESQGTNNNGQGGTATTSPGGSATTAPPVTVSVSDNAKAAQAASAYAVAYFKAIPNLTAVHDVIAQYANPTDRQQLDDKADQNIGYLTAGTSGNFTGNTAQTVGCLVQPVTGSSTAAQVSIRLHWIYSVDKSHNDYYFTTQVLVERQPDGRWLGSTAILSPDPNDLGINDASRPDGFTACS